MAFWIDRLSRDPVLGLPGFGGIGVGPGVPQLWAYNPVTNPTGARCTTQDHQTAMFGTRPPELWGDAEQAAGGFANRPFDKEGVEYGLSALNAGLISVDQFLDPNDNVGGFDIDGVWQPGRSVADPAALSAAYRTNQVNSGRGMASVPVCDLRNCSSNEIHSCYHSWVLRERIVQTNGSADSHVIFLEERVDVALPLIDRWISAITDDASDDPLPIKVARHRPFEAVDTCWIDGEQVTDMARCLEANPYLGDPRTAAGGPVTTDVLKCQLESPDRSDYEATFSDAQWERLLVIFPTGVSDWTQPSVGYQPSVPWLTFQDAEGQALPGGVELGEPPTSQPLDIAGVGSDDSQPGPEQTSPMPATGGGSIAVTLGLALLLLSAPGRYTRRRPEPAHRP